MSGQHDVRPFEGPTLSARRAGVILGVVAVAVLAVSAGCSSSTSPTKSSATGAAATKARPASQIGKPVRDARFEYVVTKLDCKPTIGGETDAPDPSTITSSKGQYCLISLTLKNIATGDGRFLAPDQHVYDAAGTKYDVNTKLGFNVKDAYEDTQVGEGTSSTAVLIFEVPKDATLVRIDLLPVGATTPLSVQLG